MAGDTMEHGFGQKHMETGEIRGVSGGERPEFID
jgi:hypothetical protein